MSEFADVQLSVSIGGICGVHPITEAIRKADYLMYLDKAEQQVLKSAIPAGGDRKSVPGRGFLCVLADRSLRKEPRQRDRSLRKEPRQRDRSLRKEPRL